MQTLVLLRTRIGLARYAPGDKDQAFGLDHESRSDSTSGSRTKFAFGLDLILDSLERARLDDPSPGP